MLTQSQTRTSAGICRPVALPAAILRSIGSFLRTYECFVTVRTCKKNDGLKPLLTSIEEIVLYKDDILPEFLAVIEGSLISSIGSSLKFLELSLSFDSLHRRDAAALVQLLPWLGSLQQLQIFIKPPEELEFSSVTKEMMLLEQVFLSVPQKVRCLSLGRVDAEALRYVGEAAAAGCLPVLEEVAFPFLQVETVKDMMSLQTVLMAASLGKNLKILFLDFSLVRGKKGWHLLELVLNVEDQTSGILSHLETLALTSFTEWRMLAEYLLLGERLPGLKEVYNPDQTEGKYAKIHHSLDLMSIPWYEIDSQTCRSWFDLLYLRPLQTFNAKISFSSCFAPDCFNKNDRILELFRCLSKRALPPKCISAIKEVELIGHFGEFLCSDTFEPLARAIRLGNLRCLESLAFRCSPSSTFDAESFASLGKALDRVFLPRLTSLSFGMEGLSNLNHKERFLLFETLFGSIPTGGLDNLQKFEVLMPSRGGEILLGALAESRPNCFRHLPEVCLSRVNNGISEKMEDILEKMALVCEMGVFPSVVRVKISVCYLIHAGRRGENLRGNLGEGMSHLLCALSGYTDIKELHVKESPDSRPMCEFTRPLLESMLSLLSGSTSPALFPSLHTLKITIDFEDDESSSSDLEESSSDDTSSNIKPFLLSIKAVKPPNLKIIMLGEERI